MEPFDPTKTDVAQSVPTVISPTQPSDLQSVTNPTVPAPEPVPFAQSFESATPVPTGHRKRSVALALLALVVVAGALGGIGYNYHHKQNVAAASRDNTVATAALQFIGYLNAGNNSQAYDVASTNLRSGQTQTDFNASLGDLSASTPVFSNMTTSVKGTQATYAVTESGLPPTDDGRTDGVFTLSLVQQDKSQWRVDSVQVQ